MKDINGKTLKVGDGVVFTYYKYSDIHKGKIVGVTLKTIKIKSSTTFPYTIRKSNIITRVVKI